MAKGFLVTPGHLETKAELYHQLGSFISAGVPILQSLQTLQRSPPAARFRPMLAKLSEGLMTGMTFTQALQQAGDWVPYFDLAMIEAGERSGRLDIIMRMLSAYYRQQAALTKRMISQLLYPLFLFHFAVLVFPTSSLVDLVKTGDLLHFALTKSYLLAVYAGIGVVMFLCAGRHGAHWRAVVERLAGMIPILGKARRELALARLAAALEALLNAGVPIIQAWMMAAETTGSAALRQRILSWKVPMEMGRQKPGELLSQSPEFPELFANLYVAGEVSGQLDDTLRRLHTYFNDEGNRRMDLFVQWMPKLIYLLIAGAIGWQVIQFWSGYFAQINAVM